MFIIGLKIGGERFEITEQEDEVYKCRLVGRPVTGVYHVPVFFQPYQSCKCRETFGPSLLIWYRYLISTDSNQYYH